MKKRLISILLSLVLVLSLMPVMSLRAYAYDGNPYTSLLVTTDENKDKSSDALEALQVTFNGISWYIIGDNSTAVNAGTVTLFAKNPIGASIFDESSKAYSTSTVKDYLERLTTGIGSFVGVANAIVPTDLSDVSVTGAKLWLLSISEAEVLSEDVNKCNQATGAGENFWWLRSPGYDASNAAFVKGDSGYVYDYGGMVPEALGVRPALKLDLEKVVFDSVSKTFSLKTSLGTGAMANPWDHPDKDTSWRGSYVYYGSYDDQPVKYRVLAPSTNIFGGNTMFLDCDTILFNYQFRNDHEAADANQWSASDVRTKLNNAEDADSFLNKGFNAVERAAIAESTIVEHEFADFVTGKAKSWFGRTHVEDDKKYYTPLEGDRIFLLDVEDVLNTAYGYSDNCGFPESGTPPYEIVDNHKKSGSNTIWWLRSPESDDSSVVALVEEKGCVGGGYVESGRGVSPAFNVSLSSVIFSSLVSGTSGLVGAEYKLTLKDPGLTIVAGAVPVEGIPNKYLIPYDITDNSDSADPTQVSVVVTDKPWTENGWSENTTLLQYTKLDGLSGTGTFTLDSSITGTWGIDFHVYVLAEDVNAGNATDYASAPLEIAPTSYLLKFDAYDGTGLMASMNVCYNDMFTFPACEFTAPAGKPFDHWEMSGVNGLFYPDKPGQNEVKITSSCADSYGLITVTAKWKDLPAATVTTKPTAKDLTYTGSEQDLVTAGVASGGEMQYALGTDNVQITSLTTDWDTTIPARAAAETYYVWYKAKGDATHSDSTPECVTVTIKNKPSPPSPSPTPSYTYYTVKFEMNGHGEQVSSQTVRSGLKAKEPSDPTAEEYYFAGWFEDAELTKEYDFSSPVRKSMTLYARWEEIRYTVSFDLDGKGSIEPQWVRKNKTAERPEEPTAEGYTFDGWYTSDGTAYDFSTPVTKDITIYAKWVEVIPPVIVHRLYNPNSGEHFYTASDAERDYLVEVGWSEENGFMVPAEGIPVYRLYNPNGNDHHFTSNRDEAELLKSLGWIDEGIAFYTSSDGIPVYRAYNPYSGYHFFTADKEEFDYLITLGWVDEGIAWYAVMEG